jgi:hypothetical protein
MTHKALEQYFHEIINQPRIVYVKETTMFEKTKMFFNEQIERCAEKINSLLTKPTAFVEEDPTLYEDGYWAFEMYTPEYTSDGEDFPVQHTVLVEPHEGTWLEVLDTILDAMEAHYGYNIKEQVYYSVTFPMNDVDPETGEPYAGYGRCLNDELFQQLLLAHPELYESQMFGKPVKDLYA